MIRNIYLIGGMPTAGKSTIAKRLSIQLGLPYISTDQIRTIMMASCDPTKYPALFSNKNLSAERFFARYTPEQVADLELEMSREIWPVIEEFINDTGDWRDGGIIEGVNILPGLVRRSFGERSDVKAVFVSDNSQERLKDAIYQRGLYGPACSYSDDLKPLEIEWVHYFDKAVRADAIESGYPIVEYDKSDGNLKNVFAKMNIKY